MSGWRSRPLEEMEVGEARAERALHLEEALEFSGAPEPVAVVEDRVIPNGEHALGVRVYRPSVEGALPVLVFFHGGGWVFGDLETMDRPCRVLANSIPAVVVSVDYRLAPEYPFPVPCEDAFRVLQYVAGHAVEYGIDASRLAVGGDSAGGNLAAAVALMARDRGGPRIAFQLLIYPVTDFADERPSMAECAEGFGLTRAGMVWFWKQYARTEVDARSAYASVVNARTLAGVAPALIITAECDVLRDQGEAYGELLRAAGVQVEVQRYPGMIHGFYPLRAAVDASREAQAYSALALRRAFAG
ncbi:MAG: alpha/beta hydrolase [Acidobacteria bacterium]|nr:alpha/beta hydrolase [Acidobacteriota bacterium]